MSDPLRDQLQTTLGTGYTLARELGGGGMSRVFVAREEALDRDVVIKVLAPELAEGMSAERFAREIRLAAGLQEPHIVPVLSAGVTAQGLPFYTMPYVRGESLRARLVHGPMPLAEAVAVLRDVATALDYAHGRGLVHRDIKPENVLLSGRTAVVTDFGIAKALQASRTQAPDSPPSATLTQRGTSLGTPAYMAPEQAAGDPDTDHRADLYAWGVVAYELLAGRHPFAEKISPQQLMAAHFSETPAPLPPSVPGGLAALVMQCLAKDPADRPASAVELLAALEAVGSGTSRVTLPARPATARRRQLVALGLGALVVAVGVGTVIVRSGRHDRATTTSVRASGSPSLAVLPFEHQGDTADVYLTDGLTDEIRGKLAGVSDLVVIARASSNAYRATKDSPGEIAEALGVRYLLTGTVRVTGTGAARRVIVRPELVEVTTAGQPQTRWGQPFDVEGSDVLQLQGDIAGQVVAAMQVAVVDADRARLVAVPTSDPAAYDAYLRGQDAVRWGADPRADAAQRAIPFFEEAIRRDSTLVDAWAGLAYARATLYTNGREQTATLADAARIAAEQTLVLDRGGARGLTARGLFRGVVLRDLIGSRADLEAAVRADPGNAQTRTVLAFTLIESLGRPAEALPHLERALALDPRNALVPYAQCEAFTMLGRFAEARIAGDRAVLLMPGEPLAAGMRFAVDLAAGDTSAIRATMARLVPSLQAGSALLDVAAEFGWTMDAPTAARALNIGVEAYSGDRAKWALARANAHFLRRDTASARVWADTAVRYLTPTAPTDASYLVLLELARAQALAGRHGAAAAHAIRGIARLREEMGADRGDIYARTLWDFAATAALAGRRDSALAWLREGRGQPSILTPDALRLHPLFASLRGDSQFDALLAIRPR